MTAYCTVDDLKNRIAEKKLIQLADDGHGQIDTARCDKLIEEASSLLNAYANTGGFTIPLVDAALARGLTAALTICSLVRGTELLNKAREQECKEIREFLQAVAKGDVQIEDLGAADFDVIKNDMNTTLRTSQWEPMVLAYWRLY